MVFAAPANGPDALGCFFVDAFILFFYEYESVYALELWLK